MKGKSTKDNFVEVLEALSRHRCFSFYLRKIEKEESDDCYFCDELDTSEYTIFLQCKKWNDEKRNAPEKLACDLSVRNLTFLMVERNKH